MELEGSLARQLSELKIAQSQQSTQLQRITPKLDQIDSSGSSLEQLRDEVSSVTQLHSRLLALVKGPSCGSSALQHLQHPATRGWLFLIHMPHHSQLLIA